MKIILILLTVAGSAGWVAAQDVLSHEQLEKAVPRLFERATNQENPPFEAEVEAAKAFGMKIKEFGAIVLPAKNLTRTTLAKVDKEVMPIGQLWLARLAPVVGGKGVPGDQLRPIRINTEKKEQTLQLLYLGVRKTDGGSLELVIFGRPKAPVATLALKKAERSQETTVELDMHKGSESFGLIEMRLLGQYEASLPVDEWQP